jgi:adenine-specific DNA-methyltransferase
MLDPEKIEHLRGTVSLAFQPGKNKRVAVKVIDMRGNEVIRVLPLAERKGWNKTSGGTHDAPLYGHF